MVRRVVLRGGVPPKSLASPSSGFCRRARERDLDEDFLYHRHMTAMRRMRTKLPTAPPTTAAIIFECVGEDEGVLVAESDAVAVLDGGVADVDEELSLTVELSGSARRLGVHCCTTT